jgi:diguanylate cyclase (GGDEF)-like protein
MINDSFGIEIGNKILKEFASRLKKFFRPGSYWIFRMVSDKFLIVNLFTGENPTDEVVTIVRKVKRAVEKPFKAGDREVFLNVKLGFSFYPNHGNAVITKAEVALNAAKESGAEYLIFSQDLEVSREILEVLNKIAMEKEIDKGKEKGGGYKESKQYGKYIVWPENLDVKLPSANPAKENIGKLITATAIGKYFELSANKINFILSEIGWLEKSLKGWIVTVQGKKQGGIQAEDQRTGIPYVRWPESILESNSLLETIGHVKGTGYSKTNKGNAENEVGYREKFEAKRAVLASHVWQSMKSTDSRECRNCHDFESMDFDKQESRSSDRHEEAFEEGSGKTCIDCHQGIAHHLPKGWEKAAKEVGLSR